MYWGGGVEPSVSRYPPVMPPPAPRRCGNRNGRLLKSEFGVAVVSALSATTAVVNAPNFPTNFVADFPDTATQDAGATLGLDGSVSGPLNLANTPYSLVAADSIELVVTGDLNGITSITWDVRGDKDCRLSDSG